MVSHAGSVLPAQVADKTGLTTALTLRSAAMKERPPHTAGPAAAGLTAPRGECPVRPARTTAR